MSISKIKVQEFLARLPLFSELDQVELDHIAAATQELHVPKGRTIFNRGEPCSGFHSVVYGQVKLYFTSPGGSEKVVEIISPGHSFGEALMFMEKPYIVSADALADSMLLHVSKDTVFSMLDRDGRFARRMLSGLSRRLHGLICDVEAYSLRSATQRVIGYLLQQEKLNDGDHITLDVPKTVIASRLNLTPEHLSRILHELMQEKVIEVNRRDITILDVNRLRQY
ncbi:Crp/Fnr family transcriptional regulator [Noviherbaspirillum galbum]|uniref:Crp/Fnr family transcriptional regulator n=1 Tax=Noviherbaspirillum galbum TaxID=2709383 RepID=A0A6B3SP36_9BURK|nr:Crp/Fnr family transcriptional regulator [Noviherbaspirillum galbum]NEX62268.1 Crp/Fnr family transcriptional regulator [Noviherbaspirillum galbum]